MTEVDYFLWVFYTSFGIALELFFNIQKGQLYLIIY